MLAALLGALRKLQDGSCQQLLEDFRDAEGRLLRDNLSLSLIHEMLHSLGLGENPPSAREINAQVWRRCGG